MEQWLPRQPLILTPVIPLIWTVGWLCTVSARLALGLKYPQPSQLQDSVLLVSAFILVANIYNLILIYQQTERYRDVPAYSLRAALLAIILIISVVLAWGQPQVVLVPNRLNKWVAIFIVLNFGQAVLGQFFTRLGRPKTRRKLASLTLPTVTLLLSGLVVPNLIAVRHCLSLLILVTGLLLWTGWSAWQNLAGIRSQVPATNSVIYELLVGINLVTAGLAIVSGIGLIVLDILNINWSMIYYYFAISLSANGIGGLVIAAMQRYHNDYRYGHVKGHPRRYVIGGCLLMILFLLLRTYFV